MDNSLAAQLAKLIDQEGVVRVKDSTPFAAQLAMDLKRGGYEARLYAVISAQANGSTWVQVRKGRRILFEANGDDQLNFQRPKRNCTAWIGALFHPGGRDGR